jgi:TRAP transporter TAXI family solute receptor
MSQRISRIAVAAAATALIGVGASNASAQNILRGDAPGVGSVNHTIMIVLSKILATKAGITMQVNEGQTLTRSAIKLGSGRLDILPLPQVAIPWMKKGVRMYKKQPDKAKAAVKNIRLIAAFIGGYYHHMVWADSPIKTHADLKGKRVFVGPPAGGASITAMAVIRAVSGLEPKKDYTAVRLPWGAGLQAMQDGKLDAFIRPSGLGAASIDQLGSKRKFRLLDIGHAEGSPAWKKFFNSVGRTPAKIPAGSYKNQANNDKDLVTNGLWSQLTARADLSEDVVYKITKALWENIDEMHQTAVTLRSVRKDDPIKAGNVPLHPGAMKYYKEIGVEIPKHLM